MHRTTRSPRTGVKVKKKMTKEQMQLAIIKKKECDAKALAIVEQLLEPQVDREWLVENLKNINRCHMEDVIEERAITKVCGYVLCQKPLTVVYKQQYHISLKSKKVFDITKRKNFCSSACFGASNYLLEQMLTSPLWMRDKEEIPCFRIFSKSILKSTAPHGEEVDIALYEHIVKDEDSATADETETTSTDSPNAKEDNENNINETNTTAKSKEENIKGIIQDFVLDTFKNIDIKEYGSKETSDAQSNPTTSNEKNTNSETVKVKESTVTPTTDNTVQLDKNKKPTVNTGNDNIILEQNNITTTSEQSNELCTKEDEEDELVQHVLQNIQCDQTENSKVEPKIRNNNKKDKSDDENDFIEQYVYPTEQNDSKRYLENESSSTNLNTVMQEENKNIPKDNIESEKKLNQNLISECKKKDKKEKTEKLKHSKKKRFLENKLPVDINLAARVEQSFQEWVCEETIHFLFGDESIKQKTIEKIERQDKYSSLCEKLNRLQFQEEQEDAQILEKPVLKPAPHFAVLQEEGQKLNLKVRAFFQGKTTFEEPTVNSFNNDEQDTDNTFLPLTDSHAPQILRRKIFLDRLDQVLPDLLRTLAGNNEVYARVCVNYTSVRCTAVKALINTFSLSAKNIIFKTAEWTLVGLVIIKMLSLLDPWLATLLSTKQANLYISMILTSYKLDLHYLNILVDSFNPNMNPK